MVKSLRARSYWNGARSMTTIGMASETLVVSGFDSDFEHRVEERFLNRHYVLAFVEGLRRRLCS